LLLRWLPEGAPGNGPVFRLLSVGRPVLCQECKPYHATNSRREILVLLAPNVAVPKPDVRCAGRVQARRALAHEKGHWNPSACGKPKSEAVQRVWHPCERPSNILEPLLLSVHEDCPRNRPRHVEHLKTLEDEPLLIGRKHLGEVLDCDHSHAEIGEGGRGRCISQAEVANNLVEPGYHGIAPPAV